MYKFIHSLPEIVDIAYIICKPTTWYSENLVLIEFVLFKSFVVRLMHSELKLTTVISLEQFTRLYVFYILD